MTLVAMKTNLDEQLAEYAQLVEEEIASILRLKDITEVKLFDAMRYGCLNGGKRLRPFLVLASSKLFGVDEDCALRVAAAVEFVHCYSLMHDDLPAMDNADMRRGQPSVHCKFDQATAILAGDGLLTDAFDLLSDPETHEDPKVRCNLVAGLAKAAGSRGMVAGQMLDLLAEEVKLDEGEVTRLQRLKTGKLIAFACESGAILGRAPLARRHALHAYAHDLGLSYQITDDLLDVEGSEGEVGKPVGQDEGAGKATFVSIMGAERAREQAEILANQAIRHLDIFETNADPLRDLARYVIARRS